MIYTNPLFAFFEVLPMAAKPSEENGVCNFLLVVGEGTSHCRIILFTDEGVHKKIFASVMFFQIELGFLSKFNLNYLTVCSAAFSGLSSVQG